MFVGLNCNSVHAVCLNKISVDWRGWKLYFLEVGPWDFSFSDKTMVLVVYLVLKFGVYRPQN